MKPQDVYKLEQVLRLSILDFSELTLSETEYRSKLD